MQDYERIGKVYLSVILPLIPTKPKERRVESFFGHKISLATKRLRVFAVKGTACVICGIPGHFFAIERHQDHSGNPDVNYRPNLYAVDSSTGEEIMITIDHIVPKAKGGKNSFHNLQPMCEHCNFQKGDIILCQNKQGQ